MLKLKQHIREEFGVDWDELIGKYSKLASSGIVVGHENEIQAAVAVLSHALDTHGDKQACAVVLLLFTIGYQAGLDASDLSAFEGVLEDGAS